MHNNLCDVNPRGPELRVRWGFAIMAMVLLSFGVGATTAAFTLMNGVATHSARDITCATMLQISGDPSTSLRASIPSSAELQERVSDAYQTSYEAAGDAVGSWSDAADNLDGRPLAPLFAAGALAVLVACTRGAARLLAAPRGPAIAAGSALGALFVAAMLINVFGFPSLGIRAIAFAISVSLLATKYARTARKHLVAATG